MHKIQLIVAALCLLLSAPAQAQVERTTLFGVGGGHMLDTYLSNYPGRGPSVSISLATARPAHWGRERVETIARYSVEGIIGQGLRGSAQQYEGLLQVGGGWRRVWSLAEGGLRISIGGTGNLYTGGAYITTAGNNPAQARLAADLSVSMAAAYRFAVKQHTWQARLQLEAPLLGAAFSPQYGQSYYELFSLGHYNRNVCFTYPVNTPSARLQATLSIPVGKSALVVGYGADVQQQRLNGIRRHAWYNQLLIGFSRKLQIIR